jgi:hypothetical protein
MADTDGDVRKAGFGTLFNGNTTYGLQYQFLPTIFGRPGMYEFIVGYTTKAPVSFSIDKRQLIAEIIGVVPVAREKNNYAVLVTASQYLWVADGSAGAYKKKINSPNYKGPLRHDLPPVGIGIFGRAGWAPDDRNVIDQFYSIGIGGYGMIFPDRDSDQWGIGYAASHISEELRAVVGSLGIGVLQLEQAVEVFYNFELTPAMHLIGDLQWIKGPVMSRKAAVVLSGRLQMDF